MGLQCRKIALLALGLVLCGTATVRTLMFTTCTKASAESFACRKFVTIKSHIRANSLDLSGPATTIDLDDHLTWRTIAEVALLHAAMPAIEQLFTNATTNRDRIRTGVTHLAHEQRLDRLRAAWTGMDYIGSG